MPDLAPRSERPGPDACIAQHGIVASASRRAAMAGLAVLARGGNAFDAAIATASVEWFTLPGSCGLGGDFFAVLHDARSGRTAAINGSGVAGRAATRDYYTAQGLAKMPLDGWHSASVPGAADAYATLNREFGTMPLSELLAPAIGYAEDGIVVSERMSRAIAGSRTKLGKCPDSVAAYLPKGSPPAPGERWALPDLARSIRAFAEQGADAFYRGEIAKEIVRASTAAGGPFSLEDFGAHATDVYDPIRTRYRGLDVCETAPPSQGLIVLEWLNLLEGFDLRAWGAGSADSIHAMVEAKKLAFADRLRYLADPRFQRNPVEALLSARYAAKRRRAIDMKHASDAPLAGDLSDGDTSYFAVADGKGNAISLIHSLSAGFGSGVVAGRTGVLLNNRAGRGFSLEEGHPNAIAPGKRTMHTLNCYLVLRDGRPFVVGGTPGGDRQPQWNVQTLVNLIDFGMDLKEAIDAPKWVSWPGTDPAAIDTPLCLRVEDRLAPGAIADLEHRGHRVERMGPWAIGSGIQLISFDGKNILRGAGDPRLGGVALGW